MISTTKSFRLLSALGLVAMGAFVGCGSDDAEVTPTADTGVDSGTNETSSDTGAPVEDTATDSGSSDAVTDAPVAAEPKLSVVKISEANHDRFFGVTYDAAGNIYATGVVAESVGADADFAFIAAKFKGDGTLDTTFGTGGIAKKNVIAKKGGEVARGIVVQSTGKVVIAGQVEHEGATDDRDRDIALVRFNADGTLDSTFGTAGVVILDLSAGEVSGSSYIADSHWGLALAADDALVVSGSAKATGRTDTDFAIVKLLKDGARDNTFGTSGVTLVDIDNTSASPRAVTVLSTGAVVGAGYMKDKDSITRPVLFKLTSAGVLDTTFGVGGIFNDKILDNATEAYGAALQGTSFVTLGYGRAATTESLDWLSLRVTSDGKRDMTYGGTGLVRIDVAGQNDNGRAVAILPDQRIIMVGGGRPTATNVEGMVAIYTKDGAPDTTWAEKGYKLWDIGGPNDFFWGVAVSPKGDQAAVVGLKGAATDGTAGTDDAALLTIPLKK